MLVLTALVGPPALRVPKALQVRELRVPQELQVAMEPPELQAHPERWALPVLKALPVLEPRVQPGRKAPLVHWEQLVQQALALTEPQVLLELRALKVLLVLA